MNYYNLPKDIDRLVDRLKTKATSDNYTNVVIKINLLKRTTWYQLVFQLKLILEVIILYQESALDGDLQDFIDELYGINWYNFLQKTKILKRTIELIETL